MKKVQLQTLDKAEAMLVEAVHMWRKEMGASFTSRSLQAGEVWAADFAYWLKRHTKILCAEHEEGDDVR